MAGPDNSLHTPPTQAITAALGIAGWMAGPLDFFTPHEAFAAVSLHFAAEPELNYHVVNLHNGAIELGHPIGAFGARMAVSVRCS